MQKFPLMISGKLSRKAIASALASMSNSTYETLNRELESAANSNDWLNTPAQAQLIQETWSSVLNVQVSKIGLDTSFYELGGDSVSAMQVVSRCRKLGLAISVHSILEYKTIRKLAPNSHSITPTVQGTQNSDSASVIAGTLFPLSPIQRHFFHINGEESTSLRYNQCLCLKVNAIISIEEFQQAISIVVRKHPMLRARVQLVDGVWMQSYVGDGPSTFRIAVHNHSVEDETIRLMEEAHESINIVQGPVFSVDFFHLQSDTLLFINAHHMVIDLVSWRAIMQDLEDIVRGTWPHLNEPMLFQQWVSEVSRHVLEGDFVDFTVVRNKVAWQDRWGLAQIPNLHRDVLRLEWSLNEAQNSYLLNEANAAFGTEPVDLMLSAFLYSFAYTFEEPNPPAVYLEGHGRQSWDPRHDLSERVGRFTVMDPIALDLKGDTTLESYVRGMKDIHRQHHDKGLSYFTHYARTLLQDYDRQTVIQEMQFNYHGTFQQLEREDSLFTIHNQHNLATDPISPDAKRNNLLEVEASVHKGALKATLEYNRHSSHIATIEKWMACFKSELVSICQSFPRRRRTYTFTDFELLPLRQ